MSSFEPEKSSLYNELLLSRLQRAVSSRFGIIHAARLMPLAADDLQTYIHGVAILRQNLHPSSIKAGGGGLDAQSSLIAALSEGLERYSLSLPLPPARIAAAAKTWRELIAEKRRTIDPQDLKFYAAFQYDSDRFQFHRFREDLALDWVEGTCLRDGSSILIPSCLVYRQPGRPQLCELTTSGMACHESMEAACVNAILELIERDAFGLRWWTQQSPPLLNLDKLQEDPSFQRLSKKLQMDKHDIKIAVLETPFGIPVFVCGLFGRRGADDPAFVLSAGCATNPRVGLKKALVELGQCHHHAREIYSRRASDPMSTNFDQRILSFEDGIAFYFNHANLKHVNFFFSSRETRDIDSFEDFSSSEKGSELNRLVGRLGAANLNPIVFDITPRDVRSLGFFVSRALVPGLIPLNCEHRNRPFGNQQLGLASSALNFYPHPFP